MRRALAGLLLALAAGSAAAQAPTAPARAYPVIRDIVFQGNTMTLPKVLLRELPVRVGDAADPERIERGRQNILDLGLFRAARVEQVPVEDGVRLRVVVKEKLYVLPVPRVSASSDGGYGFGAQLRWNNVGGRNHTFNGFWERKKFSEGSADEERRGLATRYSLSYLIPYFADTRYTLSLEAAHTDAPITEPEAYDEAYNSSLVTLTRRLGDEPGRQGWTVGGGLLYKNQYTSGPNAPAADGRATAVVGLLGHRDLRYKVYSDEGHEYNARLEVATEGVASDYHSVFWGLDYAGYYPVGRKPHQTLQVLASVGARHGGPVGDDLFELGGTGSLRGFEPEIAQGDFAYRLSFEHLRPVFRNSIRTLALLDLGNAFREPGDLNFDRVLLSAGIGMRIRVQAFVDLDLELGVAWPLNGGPPRFFASKI